MIYLYLFGQEILSLKQSVKLKKCVVYSFGKEDKDITLGILPWKSDYDNFVFLFWGEVIQVIHL